MAPRNQTRHQTAFTVSIEAREGVTTGISAADRAHTISVAINHNRGRQDIVSPGHVFPLIAQDGGVLVRAGHTEAAVDVARLAGLNPSGVICEIMNDDGTMARMPDLVTFAQTHGLKIATIADLIAYRRRTEQLVERIHETAIHSRFGGDFKAVIYATKIGYIEHVALVRGDVSGTEPVLVRMHQHSILADSLGDMTSSHFFGGEARARGGELEACMRLIAEKDRGVVVIIREPTPTSLSRSIREREGQAMRTPIAQLRQFGIGAQILLDLGVRDMILLSNTRRTIIGLDGYGLHVIDQQPIPDLPDDRGPPPGERRQAETSRRP
jgi:3,4-dihydroxy 2-butanone 4-phosphate synthase/GTP cyclohydrolase II